MGYWITSGVYLLIYLLGIIGIKYINKNKFINIICPCLVFVFSVTNSINYFILQGVNGWDFQNTLPVANVSPFMFFSGIIIMLLPNLIKKYGNTLISLLSLGMFIAGIEVLVFNAVRDYTYYWNFVMDAFNHLLFSLFGIYLVKTNQTHNEVSKQIISGTLIVGVAFIMLVLNLIFRTSFFGLSLYGNHNIYNFVICESSLLSALVYFTGLIIVLFSGLMYKEMINKIYKSLD
jgi:hypothetical protein